MIKHNLSQRVFSGKSRLFAYSLLISVLAGPYSLCQPVFAQSSETDIQHYQRKYISFFYPQDFPLNPALATQFKSDFPRFNYHLTSQSFNLGLLPFLRLVQADQAQRAGGLAADKEAESTRFGDKVVSWSETRQISQSAFVFVPVWGMSKIELDGPYPTQSSQTDKDWEIKAENTVSVEMGLYQLAGQNPTLFDTLNRSWTVNRSTGVKIASDKVKAAAAMVSTPEHAIDIEKTLSSEDRKKVLASLRQREASLNQTLTNLENQNPYDYMMSSAVRQVDYNSLIEDVRRLSAFLIRAEISEPDMQKDRITIDLAEGETPATLGIRTDASYKVIEYLKGSQETREIGYIKVRDRLPTQIVTQPIIASRDFELGDQVIEYPKSQLGLNLRGGLLYDPSLSGTAVQNNGVGGGLGLDLDYNLGPLTNLSETYLSLSGGYYNGLGVAELGLQKKWYFRQLILGLGVRGGFSFADEVSGGGVTGLLSLQWQATPDFVFGIDTGWRQYSNLSGALLEGVVRFEF